MGTTAVNGSDLAVSVAAPRRLAVAVELARSGALRRAIRWEPAVAGCVIGAVLIVWRHGAAPSLVLLRAASLVLVLGIGFVMDDRSAQLLEAVPTSWRYRYGLRALIAAGFAAGAFAAAMAVLAPDGGTGFGVGLEVATVLAIGLLAAVVALRQWGVEEPGVVAGPVTLGLVGALVTLPSAWPLLVGPGPHWAAAHLRCAAVLLVVVLLLVRVSRDPASRPLFRIGGAVPVRR
jgi:hypothetical protein